MSLPPQAYLENVVVIGSSDQGLEAVEHFFESVPADSGRCFFVIPQLSPGHAGVTAPLLAAHRSMPVLEMVDGGHLQPNKIFICPAGTRPIADGLRVSLQPSEKGGPPALDAYFESLANTFGGPLAVVVLSGTGSDGVVGAQRIHAAGGAVFVQSPQDCKFPGMAESVLASGVPCVQATARGLWQMMEAAKFEAPKRSDSTNEALQAENERLQSTIEALQRDNEALRAKHEVLSASNLSRAYLLESAEADVLSTFTDLTDLKALQKRFEFALESARMSWWDWDLQSDHFEVRTGDTCILGDNFCMSQKGRADWMELVHEDDRAMVQAALDAHLLGETDEWTCEHRFRTMGNEWVWVSNRGLVTRRDPSGKALYMMGNTVVIDALKKALIEATYQRDMFAAAGKIASLGSWEYTVETDRVVWSEQTRNIMEVDADFDPNLQDSFEFFPEVDRARLEAAFKALIQEGKPYDLDLRCVSRQGRLMYTLAAGRPQYDPRGKIVGAIGVFQDITKTELKEHEMEAFFALSPDFQATIDFDGNFQSFSPSWQTALGYPEGFLAHTAVADIVAEEHRGDFLRSFSSVVEGAAISNYETRVLNYSDAQGHEAHSELWLSWSFSSDPDLKLVFASARCVTEQRQINQRLIDERARAEQANRAKSDFLAVMSHELRTPLNPILGFSDLLLGEIQNPEHQEILQTIVDSGEHLIGLIDEVLDYSKLEAGKTEIELSEFSLEDFALEKIRLMRGQLKDGDVVLKHSIVAGPFAGGALPTFVGDVSVLTQILRNLLSNALKFTSVGEVALTVEVKSAENAVAMVCFSVSDTGVGIAREDHAKIFEAFAQADTSRTRKFGGTGLGLAICKQLSDLLGGEVTVESALGQGATFTLNVPLAYLEAGAEDAVASAAAQADNSNPPSTRLRAMSANNVGGKQAEILIVEDNATNQFYLDTLLQRQGCLQTIVEDGESAIALIEQDPGRFRWIFLDLHMPGMGGLAALEKLRAVERQAAVVPAVVIVMTADAGAAVRRECLAKGANEFLVKPAPVHEVLGLLERYSVMS